MKRVSIVTPCYQESGNVADLAQRIRQIMSDLPGYEYEHVYIDNGSTDGTREILRVLAKEDPRVKVIMNTRNFGHIRSGYHAVLQVSGDVVVCLASDFQDPPELIPEFLSHWSRGSKLVLGVKTNSKESPLVYALRSAYYGVLASVAEQQVVPHATGFGLYDRSIIDALRRIDDPYPFFRGLLAEIGIRPVLIPYTQPRRASGHSSQSFWTLYDLALLGIVNHSKLPLRMAVVSGAICAFVSMLTGLGYLLYKLLFWDSFSVGIAPALIGIFFLSAIQLIFIGILGEYLGAVWTHVRKHPHVFEEERLNF